MTKRRKKASDIFNSSEPFLHSKVKFIEAFPKIEKVNIEVTEFEDFMMKDNGIYPRLCNFNGSDLFQYVDCSENSCYRGGFNIGNILNNMVSKNLTFLEDSIGCIGNIGGPSGKRCAHEFHYIISVKYK